MTDPLKLMCILAHPDDETLSTGGILAKYAAENIETYLICATRGERGWAGKPEENPGLEGVGKIREAELRCAVQALGIHELIFLDIIDGELDRADSRKITGKIAGHLRRVRPQVVVTMDPQGWYGHPDHVALTQLTQAAVVQAAGPGGSDAPHAVSKLYYAANTWALEKGFEAAMGRMHFPVDGLVRGPTGWPDWQITTEIDVRDHWDAVLQALRCHASQIAQPERFAELPGRFPPDRWGIRTFYRVFSLVNGGRVKETDLFAGLREERSDD